ncbi:MAG: hypothetical protein DRP66_00825 [Planctomycetota bacterium]|nr:MAG: hypothetical protein DRP66_00825 [Planctomycetota bacterium]
MGRVQLNLDRAGRQSEGGPADVAVAGGGPAAASMHLAAEEVQLLQRRADILSAGDRALVMMYLEKGSCFSDIARVAGLNEANVARRIHKLIGRLLDGKYITCLRHRTVLGKLNLAIAKDRLIEGLSVRQIAAKRRTTVYRVRRGLLKIRLLLDGRLKTEDD